MITLSCGRKTIKPPPVCKKVPKPPLVTAVYPGPILQSWVYAEDLRSMPNPPINQLVVLQIVQQVPLIYNVSFDVGDVKIIFTMEYFPIPKQFAFVWTYLENSINIDDALTGLLEDDSIRGFDSRLQMRDGRLGLINFQARITR